MRALRKTADWVGSNPLLRPLRPAWSRRPPGSPVRRTLDAAAAISLALLYAAGSVWLSSPGTTLWQARVSLIGVCAAYLLLVTLTTPGSAASAISGERERETLDALLLTSLQPSQVAFAKLVGVLRPVMTALLALAPLLAMAMHASRLPLTQVVPLFLVLLVVPYPVAGFGIWLSGRCKKGVVARCLAYGATSALYWATLPSPPLSAAGGDNPLWHVSPAWQALQLCIGEPAPEAAFPEWLVLLATSAVLTVLCLWRVTVRLGSIER